jgi:hypothetical protein
MLTLHNKPPPSMHCTVGVPIRSALLTSDVPRSIARLMGSLSSMRGSTTTICCALGCPWNMKSPSERLRTHSRSAGLAVCAVVWYHAPLLNHCPGWICSGAVDVAMARNAKCLVQQVNIRRKCMRTRRRPQGKFGSLRCSGAVPWMALLPFLCVALCRRHRPCLAVCLSVFIPAVCQPAGSVRGAHVVVCRLHHLAAAAVRSGLLQRNRFQAGPPHTLPTTAEMKQDVPGPICHEQ